MPDEVAFLGRGEFDPSAVDVEGENGSAGQNDPPSAVARYGRSGSLMFMNDAPAQTSVRSLM